MGCARRPEWTEPLHALAAEHGSREGGKYSLDTRLQSGAQACSGRACQRSLFCKTGNIIIAFNRTLVSVGSFEQMEMKTFASTTTIPALLRCRLAHSPTSPPLALLVLSSMFLRSNREPAYLSTALRFLEELATFLHFAGRRSYWQTALLGPGRPQRRRLEREHREGAAQDIGQLIAAVGAPMIRQLRKLFAQGLHQVIEGNFLL